MTFSQGFNIGFNNALFCNLFSCSNMIYSMPAFNMTLPLMSAFSMNNYCNNFSTPQITMPSFQNFSFNNSIWQTPSFTHSFFSFSQWPSFSPFVTTNNPTKPVKNETPFFTPGADKDRFNKMVSFVYQKEGGYVVSKDENGGACNYGISADTYNSYRKAKGLSQKSVKDITKQEADDIYYNKFWKASGADKIKDDKMALMVFDTAVNMGVSAAKKMYQESGNDIEKFKKLREGKYKSIAQNNPDKQKYLNGWLARTKDVMTYSLA